MGIIRLELEKDSDVYELDGTWTFNGTTWNKRSKPQARAFQDGAIDRSDGMLKYRTLKLRGLLYGSSVSLYAYGKILLNHILRFKDFKLYLKEDGTRLSYWKIEKVLRSKEKIISGQNYTAGVFSLTLLLLDPYVYAVSGTTRTVTVDSSPKTQTVNNSSSVTTFPVITVTADTAISSLIIENESDVPTGASDGLQFSYLDNNFVDTDELVIDCVNGTVEREGTNTIRYFSGSFLKLLQGNNTITVTCQTSGATKVEFDYTQRFLY